MNYEQLLDSKAKAIGLKLIEQFKARKDLTQSFDVFSSLYLIHVIADLQIQIDQLKEKKQ